MTALAAAGVLSAALLGLAPLASANGPYANCTQAHADGRSIATERRLDPLC